MIDPKVNNVNAIEAKKLIGENKDLIIFDVRTKEEYNGGHIAGAKLIPYQTIDSQIRELEKYKDRPVLVYCASGGRSPHAVRTLVSNNFSKIYHLNHGISSWPYSVAR